MPSTKCVNGIRIEEPEFADAAWIVLVKLQRILLNRLARFGQREMH